MISFFSRIGLAFSTFFSVLIDGRIPDAVLETLAAGERSVALKTEGKGPRAEATAQRADAMAATTVAAQKPDATATQMLAVLQRDGRLIDFLMEDIAPYGDAQIGAAVRDVHAGCRKALERYISLAPVLDGEEGRPVTLQAGTDVARIKVIGNVAGQGPFRGVLRHRGWMVSRVDLPPLPSTGQLVVAPAEVEVSDIA